MISIPFYKKRSRSRKVLLLQLGSTKVVVALCLVLVIKEYDEKGINPLNDVYLWRLFIMKCRPADESKSIKWILIRYLINNAAVRC